MSYKKFRKESFQAWEDYHASSAVQVKEISNLLPLGSNLLAPLSLKKARGNVFPIMEKLS